LSKKGREGNGVVGGKKQRHIWGWLPENFCVKENQQQRGDCKKTLLEHPNLRGMKKERGILKGVTERRDFHQKKPGNLKIPRILNSRLLDGKNDERNN